MLCLSSRIWFGKLANTKSSNFIRWDWRTALNLIFGLKFPYFPTHVPCNALHVLCNLVSSHNLLLRFFLSVPCGIIWQIIFLFVSSRKTCHSLNFNNLGNLIDWFLRKATFQLYLTFVVYDFAVLDFTMRLVEIGIENDVVLALVVFSLQYVLVNHEFWKYKVKHARWKVTTKVSIFVFLSHENI